MGSPAQHLSFFISALLFWWALIHGPQGAMGYGAAVLYLFTTSVHSGVLGALITLAGSVWYPSYVGLTSSWGLTPLEDQQLGGLIMWIPAGLVYVVAGLALFAGWLREADVRAGEARTFGAGSMKKILEIALGIVTSVGGFLESAPSPPQHKPAVTSRFN